MRSHADSKKTGVPKKRSPQNFTNAYHLDVHWQASDQLTDNLRFYGCLIDYQVSVIAP